MNRNVNKRGAAALATIVALALASLAYAQGAGARDKFSKRTAPAFGSDTAWVEAWGLVDADDVGDSVNATDFLRRDGTWAVPAGGGGAVSDGDKTDITVSGSGLIWNIDSDAVGAAEIATDGVGSAEIAADAVGASEIAVGAVGTSEIATDGVDAAEIAAGAVGTSEIATDGVDSAEIAANAVGTSEIATDGVDSAEIAANAVGTAEIANGAVTYAKIQNITTGRLLGRTTALSGIVEEIQAVGALVLSGLQLNLNTGSYNDITVSGGGTTWDIAANAVGSAEIANDAVGPTEIANDAVSYADMQNVSTTDRLLGRDGAAPGDVEEIAVTNGLQFTGSTSIGIATGGVTSAMVATDTLTDSDIAANAVGTSELVDGNVTLAKLANVTGPICLGRVAGTPGAVAELTIGGGLLAVGGGFSRDALSGDITAALGSNTTAITAGVIVNADVNASAAIAMSKLATVTASRLLGNPTGSATTPTETLLSSNLRFVSSTTLDLALNISVSNVTAATSGAFPALTTDGIVVATVYGINNAGAATVSSVRVGANQVVGARGAAIANASATTASNTSQLNLALAAMRTHGLIAP